MNGGIKIIRACPGLSIPVTQNPTVGDVSDALTEICQAMTRLSRRLRTLGLSTPSRLATNTEVTEEQLEQAVKIYRQLNTLTTWLCEVQQVVDCIPRGQTIDVSSLLQTDVP